MKRDSFMYIDNQGQKQSINISRAIVNGEKEITLVEDTGFPSEKIMFLDTRNMKITPDVKLEPLSIYIGEMVEK